MASMIKMFGDVAKICPYTKFDQIDPYILIQKTVHATDRCNFKSYFLGSGGSVKKLYIDF